ncbi:type IX secretion system membrane protein PorP/SprF [Parvicella tangerina]|uniref:Uncharacterized protein n=1 Tax=Parvicella tangerina TaxID=2829795 RepID=A0A916JL97_9FLAO|nr:type IX secretion system membrane protein PorP/SprF [Parvicella tangerina]CAG5080506.1 hypothetical protein CRYO30217_01347 [Parvicella tangerina]
MIINPNNIEKWCFDYFEGNLTSLERLEFERFILEHPEYQDEFEAWKNASDSEDEKVPAFLGVEGLIVAIPFYATWVFKVSIGVILLLSIGTVGYYQFESTSTRKAYASQSRSVDLNWSPEQHKLAVVRYTDYAYGEYEVKTKTTTTYTTNYIYLNNTGTDESENVNSLPDVDQELNTLLNDHWSESALHELVVDPSAMKEEKLAQYQPAPIVEESLFSSNSKLKSSYQVDDKTLYDHLGINASRYQFLNFNNGKVKGLGSNSSNRNNKAGKNKNHATIIAQNKPNGKKLGSHKKKSSFFSNLKHLELGLTNINDPISIAPNYNTVATNPALAGQLGVTRIKTNVRNQWWGTNASVYKGSFYVDTYFEGIQAGVAYGTEYDLSADGNQHVNKHTFTYAQKFSIARGSNISVGLSYEMTKGYSLSNLPTENEFYRNAPISSESLSNTWRSDLGLSSWYSGKYFFGGFNVTNLLGNTFIATHEENTSYFGNINFSLQLGTDYKRSMFAKTVLSPYIQYDKQGDYQDFWMGGVARIRGLVLGGGVATSKSAKAMLGLQGNKFRFTVSSDYSKSMLLDQYAFSHEVSLRILIGNKNNNWSRYDN